MERKFVLVDEALETAWESLINEILKGNVIPVIGPDFLMDDEKNIHEQIVDLLARSLNIKSDPAPTTFSQLIYHRSFPNIKKNQIYGYVNQAVAYFSKEKQPGTLLKRLLETERFPFVITTSFTPLVEQTMTSVYGKEPKVLIFKNNPSYDETPGLGDIQSARDLKEPTVYYMLGKHCKCDDHPDFVVTELDMMQFCQSWVSGKGTPPVLTNLIKDKYLLFLGNNYSDWLLRFIWFSLRSNDKLKSSLFVKDVQDEELMAFLNRLEVFTQTDSQIVVNEICSRLVQREQKEQMEGNSPIEYSKDVFLSYSRRDKEVAETLTKKLLERGVTVWLDNRGGVEDAERWRNAIARGIKDCRIFVPLLTSHIEEEFAEEHEYRTEWNLAAVRASKMGNVPYIFPLAEKGFDFYNELTNIPNELAEINAVWYEKGTDMESIAEKIQRKVETVKSYTNK